MTPEEMENDEIVIEANTKNGKKHQETSKEIKKHIKEATKPEFLPAFLSMIAIFFVLFTQMFRGVGLFVVGAVFNTISILLIMASIIMAIIYAIKQKQFKFQYTHAFIAFATLLVCV